MAGNVVDNNIVTISGKIVTGHEFSHEVYGEKFYIFYLDVPRLSDSFDRIPVTYSERLLPRESLEKDTYVEIEGQYRSYNYMNNVGNKLFLTVFARDIIFIKDISEVKNPNSVYLNGFVCKTPIYRTTPFGREIADILLAVNRPYNKSDYIPCIVWGRNARFCEGLNVGDNLKIWGRIQSREYVKKAPTGEMINKTAYEVSVSKMETAVPEEKNIEM